MSFGLIAQIVFNVAILAALAVVFIRLNRPQKDDPRLSRGLQLLSSKIAVLEDLNDRTEKQVAQMLELIDAKARELQTKIKQGETQIQNIQQSMDRSLEVAKIFQDRIPHDEIIERQNTMKYITAARMAHAGRSVDEILATVDLPRGEIEFIAKVNREQLSFREEELPDWAKEPRSLSGAIAAPGAMAPLAHAQSQTSAQAKTSAQTQTNSQTQTQPLVQSSSPARLSADQSLRELGEKFRAASISAG